MRICITLVAQVVLVPVYLSVWGARTYGAWLALQSAFSLVQILDSGHSRYLGNEFLRLGARRKQLLRRTFWSSLRIAIGLGALQVGVVGVLWALGGLTYLFDAGVGDNATLMQHCTIVLLAYAIMWWILGSFGG